MYINTMSAGTDLKTRTNTQLTLKNRLYSSVPLSQNNTMHTCIFNDKSNTWLKLK